MADQHIIQDVTYSELVSLISNSGLNPMLSYRIAEFETVHYMVDGNNSIITIGENNVINHGVIVLFTDFRSFCSQFLRMLREFLLILVLIFYLADPTAWRPSLSRFP